MESMGKDSKTISGFYLSFVRTAGWLFAMLVSLEKYSNAFFIDLHSSKQPFEKNFRFSKKKYLNSCRTLPSKINLVCVLCHG